MELDLLIGVEVVSVSNRSRPLASRRASGVFGKVYALSEFPIDRVP